MDTIRRISIEHACSKLVVEYATSIDKRDIERFLSVFDKDAVYKLGAREEPMVGIDEIRAWANDYPKAQRGAHVVSNILVDVIDETTAEGSSYTTFYKHTNFTGSEPSDRLIPRCIVAYQDAYKLTAAGWKISRRSYTYRFLKSWEDWHFPSS